jgi:hypothetical protein
MNPYFLETWTDFFIAAAGAAAALAGLVIVAISVNIQQILKFAHLPARAAATISTLVLILVSCMAGLIRQVPSAFAWEILAFGIGAWIMQLRSNRQAFAAGREFQRPPWESALETVLGQIQTLPFIVAGILLLQGNRQGIYWMAAGVIAIFIFSVMNVWVLLVEILR